MNKAMGKLEVTLRNEAKRFVHGRRTDQRGREDCLGMRLLISDQEPSVGCTSNLAGNDLQISVAKALRRERAKARCGSARYDFNRHIALLQIAADLQCTKTDSNSMTTRPETVSARVNIELAEASRAGVSEVPPRLVPKNRA